MRENNRKLQKIIKSNRKLQEVTGSNRKWQKQLEVTGNDQKYQAETGSGRQQQALSGSGAGADSRLVTKARSAHRQCRRLWSQVRFFRARLRVVSRASSSRAF